MKNNTGLTRPERKALRKAKVADRLATLPRYWVFIRKSGSKYTKLVSHDIGFTKGSKYKITNGVISERQNVYDVTRVF